MTSRTTVAIPEGPGKHPAVVLVQEWWGINAHIRSLTDRLAKEGFLTLAPDLYHGTIAKDAAEAERLMKALDTSAALEDIAAAVTTLKQDPRSNGKVGVIGFCLGGALAFAAACHIEGLSAVVPFYGTPPAAKVDYTKVTAPILAHFGAKDDFAKASNAQAIKAELDRLGKPIRLEIYDAGHAFMNDSRPEAFDAESAALAWSRTIAFLKEHLGP